MVGSRAICQQRDVIDIWDAVGAGRQIAAEGVTWRTARTYYRDRELFAVDFVDQGRSPFPPFVNISQARTEEMLDERIAARAADRVRAGRTAVGSSDAAGHRAPGRRRRAGVTDDRAAGSATFGRRYVVVCAGAPRRRSAPTLGLDLRRRKLRRPVPDLRHRADLPGWELERRFYFDPAWNPGRQVLVHPCPGGTYRIDWQVPPDFDLAARGTRRRAGPADPGDRRRPRRTSGVAPVYRFHARVCRRMRVGRVLLAGDCAHLIVAVRRPRAQLGRPGRGERGLEAGLRPARLGAASRCWTATTSSGTRRPLENLDVTTRDDAVPGAADRRPSGRTGSTCWSAPRTDPAARAQVDSGRLAEPFWYVDSPLTTTDPARPFPGRPPRGSAPPVVPGVLLPDLPLRADHPAGHRLRELVRSGLLVLSTAGVDPTPVAATARAATAAPVRVLAMAELAGDLDAVLDAHAGEIWLVRPDGHLAAVVSAAEPAALTRAIHRCLHQGPAVPAEPG